MYNSAQCAAILLVYIKFQDIQFWREGFFVIIIKKS